MTITQLEYILAVEQFQHFSKAAEHCHITQPTLSMQIQKLEDELDVIIFDRSKNPIMVTDLGKKILKQAKLVLKEYSDISTIIQLDKNEFSGEFKIGIIPTLAPYIIPLFIGELSKNYPLIDLHIEELKTESIIKALENDKLDAGILVTPLHHKQIIERTLFNEPFYIYASNSHPFHKKKQIYPKDLSFDGLWLLNEGHCFRNQILNICNFKTKNNSNVFFESGNLETLKNIIDKNDGHTLLPHLATLNFNSHSKKKLCEFSTPVPSREVSLVHARIFLKEKFIDVLEKVILDNLPKSITSNKRKMNTIEIY